MPRSEPDPQPDHRIVVNLDRVLADRGMTLTELAERAGVTVVNLSVLKNGRARAVRFSTLRRSATSSIVSRGTFSPSNRLLDSTAS